MDRKETRVIHESSKIKERLLDQLKTIINVDASEIDEGESLLRELSGSEPQTEDPTTTRPPQIDHAEHGNYIHSIPNTQSASSNISDEKTPLQATDSEEEKSEVETFPPENMDNTPLNDGEKKGVGGTNLEKESKGEDIETPPHANWKEKG